MSKTNCEIAFTLEDVTAKADSTLEVNEKQSWVEPIQIHDELHKVVEYATCEPDLFKLDGTLTLSPDDMTSDYPDKVRIQWFDASGSTMADKMFYPNAGVYFCDCQIEDYYKLILTFYSTNKPYRFLKLYRILYGATKLLGNDQLLSAQIVEEISPLSDTVSVNTLNLQFHFNACSGAVIVKSGVNYADIEIAQEREVVITGHSYDEQTSLAGAVYMQTLPASAVTSVLTIEDCTLMADAQDMAQRIYDQYQERIKDEGQLLPVLAAVGDCVEVTQVSGRTYKGVMTSMDIDLTGGYLTNAVIQGA